MNIPAKTLTLNGRTAVLGGERNLLEVIRKAGIELPTFCYHSELSVYGACRLCIVDIEGRGLQASCAVKPEPGLVVKTHTPELREIRRINLELLLAGHHRECTTCGKSRSCKLLDLANRLGVDSVRFKATRPAAPIDRSNPALERDPNKCILCGDCVRVCQEVQDVGAIDFAHRGAMAAVLPAFGRGLGEGECVFCGQCARVCPTGAIMPKSDLPGVWQALGAPGRKVVAQLAPAVRVAAGEAFGMEPGADVTGKIVSALKAIGFAAVYDTSFAADLTVVEEAAEFLARKEKSGKLPLFTSCCPAWVRFCEQYHPGLLPHLSTCKSPQQMFGALARERLPETLAVPPGDVTIVSIMPCTAKKAEAQRPEFQRDGRPDVDFVMTTQELVRMITEAGLDFKRLPPESMDMPFGFTTGAGVIFGNSGGVSEAVLRCVAEKVVGRPVPSAELRQTRGEEGRREVEVKLGNATVKLIVVHSLKNARAVAEEVLAGTCDADLIEVMACPGGCVGGAGQPVSFVPEVRQNRCEGLYDVGGNLPLHRSQENPFVKELYRKHLGKIGGPAAHHLLHTKHTCPNQTPPECGTPNSGGPAHVGSSHFSGGCPSVVPPEPGARP